MVRPEASPSVLQAAGAGGTVSREADHIAGLPRQVLDLAGSLHPVVGVEDDLAQPD